MSRAGGWSSVLAALAAVAFAAHAQAPDARPHIYGLELERSERFDRLLVLADGPITPRLEEAGPERLVLHFAGAALDPAAASQLVPGVGSAIREVSAIESEAPAEVQVRIRRAPGAAPHLSQRGTIVALEFTRAAQEERRATLRLVNAPLSELVREVAKLTGERFVYDDRLQGNATVIVNEAVTPGEALEILHSTLIGKGFAAVPSPSGGFTVLPAEEARARAPKQVEAARAERARLITVLARFQSAPAEQLVNVLQPFAGGALTVVAYPPTNAVVVVGSEGPLHRWLELANALDEASPGELAVIRPRHRSAGELFALLEELTVDPLTGRARVELWVDERSNALIVRGASEPLAALRAQIAELDAAPEPGGEIDVIRPRFADPEKLAELLRGFAAGTGASGAEVPAEASTLAGRSFGVAVHPSTRALVVSADAATQRIVRDVAERLDREPPAIEVGLHVLELLTSGMIQLGASAFLPTADPGDPGNVGAISINDPFTLRPAIGFGRYVRDPVVIPVFDPNGVPLPPIILPRDIVDVHASAGDVIARTVMRPHLMTASGEEQEIAAGFNVPVPTAAAPSAQGGTVDPLQTRVNVERQDVGLRVRVKPISGEEGDVRLTVDLELSDLRPAASAQTGELGPVIGRRTLHANARVKPGGVALLGMLLEQSAVSDESGPPYLKEIPVLGTVLRETTDTSASRHLLIAVQAHTLRSADERIADAIRLRTAHERALARRAALRVEGDSWALLVATRTQRADAEALAASLGEIAGRAANVTAWTWAEAERFDVVFSGFANVAEAARGLAELEERGWSAQLIAVPRKEK